MDDDDENPVMLHCPVDGWGWPGTCPHCAPGCPCGKRCTEWARIETVVPADA